MTDAAMNVDGREQNGYDWQSRGRSKDNSEKDDPLALHNLRTASASHREHATEADAAAGESLTHTSSQLQNSRHMLGLHPTAPIIEEHDTRNESDLWWSKIRLTLKEPFAEFFGVFIMVLFGDGSVAQVLLSAEQESAPGGNGFGNYQSINWGWGLGVMLGIYVAGDSGAYLNPAITFTNCVLRKLPWRRFPMFFLGQFLGGFVGAGVVYANYVSSIDWYEDGLRTVPPSPTATAAIFCTYPQEHLTKASQFFSEFIASAILMFVIFALKDDSNKGSFSASGEWFPLGLFFLIFGLGSCFGWQTGYAINFARDFGPRLMSYAVGYGGEVWSAGGYYFWIPMIAPFLGCLWGGVMYDLFLYTGPSPVNTPWLGLASLVNPKEAVRTRVAEQKKNQLV
ncbi:hypothetical protein MBLNU230_g7696t1 [Neophaeotheca triangularis]